jgi:hypothetical protein
LRRPLSRFMPAPDTECFQIFLDTLSKNYPKDFSCSLLTDPAITTATNSYSPKLNPPENLWNEIRENYSRTMLDINAKLDEALFYVERNPTLVKSITSFPYIARSL